MEAELNPYEQQREDRIKRNTDVLIHMGILTAASALNEAMLKSRRQGIAAKTSKAAKRPSSKPSVSAEPARRSCRLKGEAPTLPPIERKENHRNARSLPSASSQSSNAHASASLDEHNLYRIRTMSESALRRRIYTIQRCDKLQSYVLALRECGVEELADEAQERLREEYAL